MIASALASLRSAVAWTVGNGTRFALVTLGVVGVGLVPVLVLPTNSDVAWLLFAAERVLDGATLHVDLIEVNPPLIVWLTLPPVALARELGISVSTAFLLWVGTIAAVSLLLVRGSLPRVLPDRSVTYHRAVWLLFLASALVIPGWVFGQREHLMYLLVLPFLVGAAGRAIRRPPPRGFRIAAALMAGVGMALKPYFLPLWLVLEGWLLIRGRSRTGRESDRPWCVENVVIGGVLVAYAGAVLLLAPEFFGMARRLAPIYVGVAQAPLRELLLHPVTVLVAFTALAASVSELPEGASELASALALATVTWVVGVFLQMKGWWYHFVPALAGSTVAIGLLVSTIAVAGRWDRLRLTVQVLAVLVLLGIGGHQVRVTLAAAVDGADFDRQLPATTALVERYTGAGDDIAVLSPFIHAAFPLVNRVEAGWNLRFHSMWPLEVVYAEAIAGGTPVTYRSPGMMESAERYFWESMLSDLEQNPPEMLLLDRERLSGPGGFDYRDYFGRAPSFRRLMKRCRLTAELGRYRIHRCGATP